MNLRPLRPELRATATMLVAEHARTVPEPARWWVAAVALRYFVAVLLRRHPLMQTQAPHAANRSSGRRTMSALAPGASPLGQTARRRAPPAWGMTLRAPASSAISVLFTPSVDSTESGRDPASRGHRTSAGGEWLATCEARIQRWAVFLLACVATAIRVAHSDVAQSSWAPWLDSTVSAAGTALRQPRARAGLLR